MVFVGIDVAKDKHDLYASTIYLPLIRTALSSAITLPLQIQPPDLHRSWNGFLIGTK